MDRLQRVSSPFSRRCHHLVPELFIFNCFMNVARFFLSKTREMVIISLKAT